MRLVLAAPTRPVAPAAVATAVAAITLVTEAALAAGVAAPTIAGVPVSIPLPVPVRVATTTGPAVAVAVAVRVGGTTTAAVGPSLAAEERAARGSGLTLPATELAGLPRLAIPVVAPTRAAVAAEAAVGPAVGGNGRVRRATRTEIRHGRWTTHATVRCLRGSQRAGCGLVGFSVAVRRKQRASAPAGRRRRRRSAGRRLAVERSRGRGARGKLSVVGTATHVAAQRTQEVRWWCRGGVGTASTPSPRSARRAATGTARGVAAGRRHCSRHTGARRGAPFELALCRRGDAPGLCRLRGQIAAAGRQRAADDHGWRGADARATSLATRGGTAPSHGRGARR